VIGRCFLDDCIGKNTAPGTSEEFHQSGGCTCGAWWHVSWHFVWQCPKCKGKWALGLSGVIPLIPPKAIQYLAELRSALRDLPR
jgi:hypothetical protein